MLLVKDASKELILKDPSKELLLKDPSKGLVDNIMADVTIIDNSKKQQEQQQQQRQQQHMYSKLFFVLGALDLAIQHCRLEKGFCA